MENIDNNVIIKYITYTPAHKKAALKYYNKNKEILNLKAKERHNLLASIDPNFKKHRAEIAKKYYHQKKQKLLEQKNKDILADPSCEQVRHETRGRHKLDKYKGLFNNVIKELTNMSSKRKLCMLLQ
jgi:deoxyadenosine/deoxycytidine kinase